MAARFESLFFISRFQAELDRLFHEALQLGEGDLPLGEWQPSIDVVETPSAVLILAEVPGFQAADLRVEVRATRILIAGTKSTSLPEARRLKFHCLERGHGRFSREIHLFSPVNTHQGKARLADGLLTLEFPKIEDKRQEARVLHIEEGEGSSQAQ
ncbi:MAG TPA: Hsp20/alpha crystallin family protein [Thermoanaerobaculia bacterium]|jgi:HSP20 family protein|nr:Hsp20/alpha crystallin family protein [Thermoanaerobaculia bacterium]